MGVGAQHCPLGLHALRGLRAAGAVGSRPRGGWPATVARSVWCQALSPARPPVLWSGQPGFREPCVPGAIGAGALADRRCSLCGGGASPGGVPSAVVWGVLGQAPPLIRLPALLVGCWGFRPLVLSGVRPRPTTHWLWVRGPRALGPVTNPTTRALACWLCPLWGRHEGARGGRLLPGCGASGDGRTPTPDLSSVQVCSRGPLPTGCGSGGCGRGDPSPTPQRALLRAVGAA